MPSRPTRGKIYVGALAVGATNAISAGGVILPAYEILTEAQNQDAAASYAVSHTLFLADASSGTYQIAAVSAVFGTASTSGALQVEVATGAQAVGAGAAQLTATLSLAGAANSPVVGALVASPTPITAGARVNLIFSGTVTGLAGAAVTVVLQRLS